MVVVELVLDSRIGKVKFCPSRSLLIWKLSSRKPKKINWPEGGYEPPPRRGSGRCAARDSPLQHFRSCSGTGTGDAAESHSATSNCVKDAGGTSKGFFLPNGARMCEKQKHAFRGNKKKQRKDLYSHSNRKPIVMESCRPPRHYKRTNGYLLRSLSCGQCQGSTFLPSRWLPDRVEGIEVVFKSEKNLNIQMFSVLNFFLPEQIDGACKVISANVHVIRPAISGTTLPTDIER